jgi:hypothetical protein
MRLSALRLPFVAGGESFLEWRRGGEQNSDAKARRENAIAYPPRFARADEARAPRRRFVALANSEAEERSVVAIRHSLRRYSLSATDPRLLRGNKYRFLEQNREDFVEQGVDSGKGQGRKASLRHTHLLQIEPASQQKLAHEAKKQSTRLRPNRGRAAQSRPRGWVVAVIFASDAVRNVQDGFR